MRTKLTPEQHADELERWAIESTQPHRPGMAFITSNDGERVEATYQTDLRKTTWKINGRSATKEQVVRAIADADRRPAPSRIY
ncbi:hypothetical protein [Paraburkholderia gardini]|uniref:hypothetical protein n=1 Tax=Paraburkholderia gardini TaxID=2823469 RepID=UPI001DE95491|nr:hypothetical protein [Paraburkholderia gardini]CAG4924760.1 hypothetical protein R69919_05238 [Paraburkholderia gardini]